MVRGVTGEGLERLVIDSKGIVAIAFTDYESIPCDHFKPELRAAAKMLKGKVEFVQINATENPDMTEEFLVEGVPTLLVFHDKEEIARYEGLYSREVLHYRIYPFYQKKPEKQ